MIVYGRETVNKSPWVKDDPWGGQDVFTPYEAMNMDYTYDAILHMDFNILNAKGETFQLWTEKKSGLRCNNPLCPASKNQRDQPNPNCPTCLGTGFVGGYDLQGEMLISVAPQLDQITYEIGGQAYFWKPQNWTMPNPRIFIGDVLFAIDQQKLVRTKLVQDEEVVRRTDNSADFDSLTNKTVTRIIKISDKVNESESYQINADYVLSNNGVLWLNATRPGGFESYFVTYEITDTFFPLYQVSSVNHATLRGKPLRQIIEMALLDRGHYLYEVLEMNESYESFNYPYAFPYSDFFERT
jgi:hypothetical protein